MPSFNAVPRTWRTWWLAESLAVFPVRMRRPPLSTWRALTLSHPVGITSSQVCVYLAELAPARIRGRIVGVQQWAIEWGILIMYLISYGCGQGIAGHSSFRVAWGIQAVPGLILLLALPFFPESPRWLAGKERWEEAHDTLAIMHGHGDRSNPVVQAEFEEVQEAVRIAQESKDVTFMALFGPKMWQRTLCGVSVQVWQQLLGGNVAMYYVVYIFQMADMVSPFDPTQDDQVTNRSGW